MNEQGKKTAVIGRREDVQLFTAIGADTFITSDPAEAEETVRSCAREGYPVIIISDDLYGAILPVIDEFSADPSTSIIAIPGKDGSSHYSNERITGLVKKAIGINLEGLLE